MALRELLLIFLLQFTAGISGVRYLYHRLGNDAILPCDIKPSEPRCFYDWTYERNSDSPIILKVNQGKVDQNLPGGARLSLSSSCSLTIINITAEDAGLYVCRGGLTFVIDTSVFLNILTISPPDADPERDDELTLTCSLLRYNRFVPCRNNSVRWVDEKGSVLLGEDDGYKFNGQTNCDSVLTVKHQSSYNRRFTCQFIVGNIVMIDAHYTPVFTVQSPDPTGPSPASYIYYIMLTLRIATLVLMIGITLVVITYRGKKKLPEDTNVHVVVEAGGDTVDYENAGVCSAAATPL